MMIYAQLTVLYLIASFARGSDAASPGLALTDCTYIVTPNGTCSNFVNISCATFDFYIQNPSAYNLSNSKFCFLPGVHPMSSGQFRVENCFNVTFVGLGTFNQMSVEDKVNAFNFNVSFNEDQNVMFLEPTTIIRCDNSSGFLFNNITALSLINLTITNCGANVTETLSHIQKTSPIISISLVHNVALLMINITNLVIETTSIQNSTGYGLMGINILGKSQIIGSSFVGNNQFVKGNLQLYDQTFTYCNDGSYYIAPRFYVNDAVDELYAGGNAVFVYHEQSNYSAEPILSLSSCLFALGVDGSILFTIEQKQVYFNPKFKSMGTGLGILMLQNINTVHITVASTVLYRNQAFYGGNLNFQVNQMSSDITVSNVTSFRAISLIGGGLYYFVNPTTDSTLGNRQDSLTLTNSSFSSDYNYDYFGILIDMSNQMNKSTVVQIERCSLYGNVVLQSSSLPISTENPVTVNNSDFITVGCYGGIGTYQTKNIYKNCTFDRTNIYSSQSDIDFIDSSVSNSLLSAFELYYSHLSLTGNISLVNNKAASTGGALNMYNSKVTFQAPLYSNFTNNAAVSNGGAIYTYTKGGNGECVFQYNDPNGTLQDPGVHLYFEGNHANVSGNVLYGGDVDRCSFDCTSAPRYSAQCPSMTTVLNKTATYVNSGSPSAIISSTPQSVCSCTNDSVDCSSSTGAGQIVYPGQTISIPIITVGQLNGISPDVILSYTCEVGSTAEYLFNCTTPGLSSNQQQTQQHCINYTYQVIEEDYIHTFAIVLVPKTAYFNLFGGTVKYAALVTVLPCPFGFIWNNTSYTCTCAPVLQKYNIRCDISMLAVTTSGTLWVGNTSKGVLAAYDHCPYDYCNASEITFRFSDQDEQCAHDRSGILCGGCKANLSAVFGSAHCKSCTYHYIWLLIPILLMGIALIALIFLLNCTVSAGTINSIILFTNIIRPGVISLMPTSNQNGFEKFIIVFIDWLNLDLGIEACFYDGMDTYAKTWLELLFPVYLLAMVVAITIGSRWSSKLARVTKRNAVPVLATLILLSYTTLFQTTIIIFSSTSLDIDNSAKDNPSVWLADGNIAYTRGKHAYLFIAGLVVTAVFIIPYTSLLLVAPWLQAKSHLKLFNWVNRLKPFIDAYQAPYKDRYRYWPGVHLVLRVVLYVVFTTNRVNDISVNLLAIILVVAFYVGMINVLSVYKNWFLNLLETFFLVNLIFVSAATLYLSTTQSFNWNIILVSILSALLVFLVVVLYHLYVLLKLHRRFNAVALAFENSMLGNVNRAKAVVAYSKLNSNPDLNAYPELNSNPDLNAYPELNSNPDLNTDTGKEKLDVSMADFYGATDSREPLMEDK